MSKLVAPSGIATALPSSRNVTPSDPDAVISMSFTNAIWRYSGAETESNSCPLDIPARLIRVSSAPTVAELPMETPTWIVVPAAVTTIRSASADVLAREGSSTEIEPSGTTFNPALNAEPSGSMTPAPPSSAVTLSRTPSGATAASHVVALPIPSADPHLPVGGRPWTSFAKLSVKQRLRPGASMVASGPLSGVSSTDR